MNEWKKVFCTHEEPQDLSENRAWLGDNFPGVALPSVATLDKWIILRYNDKFTCAQIMDVGPFSVDDDEYVFGSEKPRAEKLKGQLCPRIKGTNILPTLPDGTEVRKSNGSGIDLFPYTARQLKIKIGENVWLEWKWIEVNP